MRASESGWWISPSSSAAWVASGSFGFGMETSKEEGDLGDGEIGGLVERLSASCKKMHRRIAFRSENMKLLASAPIWVFFISFS